MRARPHLPDIGDMAEPMNAVKAREFAELLRREGARILLVAIAGKQQLQRNAPLVEARESIDQRQHAFVGEHAPDIGRGHRRWRVGQRRELLGVDSRPRNEDDGLGRNPETEHKGAVVGILHDGAAPPPPQQAGKRIAHGFARQPADARLADEERAQPRQAVDHRGVGKAEARRGAEQHRLQRDVMLDLGLQLADEAPERENRRDAAERRETAPAPIERMRDKAFPDDGGFAMLDPGRHMYFKARLLGRAGHRQPMRQEIPVLGDDVEDARGHQRGFYQRCGLGGTAGDEKPTKPSDPALFLNVAAFAPFLFRGRFAIFCVG